MKRIFYFAAMALAACTVISCEKEDPKDPGTPGGGDDTTPTKLATPNVKAEVGETEVLVSWEAVANAASYEYTVDNGAATATEATSFTLAVADLDAGNHTVSVTALPAEGSKDYTKSDAGTYSFNIEEEEGDDPNPPTGDVPEEYAAYVGTWNVQTTQTLKLSESSIDFVDEPMSMDVQITWDETAGALAMTGFSPLEMYLGAVPAYIISDDSGVMYIVGIDLGIDLGEVDSQLEGYSLVWAPLFPVGDNISCAVPTQGPVAAYTLSISSDGNTMSAEGAELDFGGSTGVQKMQAFDLIGLGASNFTFLGDTSPAGTFTFTKTGNNAPAPAVSVNPMLPVAMTLTSNAFSSMMATPLAR